MFAVTALLSACSDADTQIMEDLESEESGSHFYFTVMIPSATGSGFGSFSRTDTIHPELPYDWSDKYENEINLDDMAMYLYTVEDDGSTTLRFYNFNNNSDGSMKVEGVSGRYAIVNIDAHKWDVDQSKNIKFRIVLLCNGFRLKGTAATPADSYPKADTVKTYSKLIDIARTTQLRYTINDDWYPCDSGKNPNIKPVEKPEEKPVEKPDKNYDEYRYIPMFGTMEVSIPGRLLVESNHYHRVDFKVLWALRAAAKIEIIDDIQRDPDSEYPKIDSVTVEGVPRYISIVPFNSISTYKNGDQVEKVSIQNDGALSKPKIAMCYPDKSILDNINGTLEQRTVKQLFRLYTPEVADTKKGSFVINVVVAEKVVKDDKEEIVKTPYKMTLDGYTDKDGGEQKFDFGPIVRNHVYRLSVTKSTPASTPEPTPEPENPTPSKSRSFDNTPTLQPSSRSGIIVRPLI